ncbi:MAG: hypothetical protein AB7Q37_18515 [Pyrinomonadaceae bacterium]
MATVKGKVWKVYQKEWKNKTLYTIKIDGNDTYYRCGEKNPGNLTGKVVEFEAGEDTGSGAQVKGKVTVVDSSTANKGSGGGSVGYDPQRDNRIQYQSSRKDALEMVKALLDKGGVKLPSKTADIAQVIEGLVDHYTAQFFEDVATFGAVARANGDTGEEESTASTDDEED